MNTIIKEILFDFIKAYKSSISKERDEAIELAVDKVEALINQERQEIIEMGDEMEMPDYQDDGIEHAHEGYFKAISDYQTKIKTLTK